MRVLCRAVALGIAIVATMAPAANAARSTDFDADWRFALVNPANATDPTGRVREGARARRSTTRRGAGSTCRTTGASSWTRPPAGTTAAPASTRAASAGTARRSRCRRVVTGKRISRGVRRRLHGLARLRQRHSWSGRHPYGYTGFSRRPDRPAAHRRHAPRTSSRSRSRNQLPSSRWYSGSGIYRNVRLVVTDPVHVARHGVVRDHAGPRDATLRRRPRRTSVVSPTVARRTSRSSHGASTPAAGRSAGVLHGRDRSGTATADMNCRRRAEAVVDSTTRTATPWRPSCCVDGTAIDPDRTHFGIRRFRFDPDEGFSLNGSPPKIRASTSTTTSARSARSSAPTRSAPDDDHEAMGVNAFRTSHNPPSPEMIEVCEELGIVMMVEAFDRWRSPKTAVRLRPVLRRAQRRGRHGDGARGDATRRP